MAVIPNGLSAGMTAKDIYQAHKLKKSTVYDMKNRFEA
jgi:transposase